LNVSENKVPGTILRPMKSEVTGERGKLHSEELQDLYASCNINTVI